MSKIPSDDYDIKRLKVSLHIKNIGNASLGKTRLFYRDFLIDNDLVYNISILPMNTFTRPYTDVFRIKNIDTTMYYYGMHYSSIDHQKHKALNNDVISSEIIIGNNSIDISNIEPSDSSYYEREIYNFLLLMYPKPPLNIPKTTEIKTEPIN